MYLLHVLPFLYIYYCYRYSILLYAFCCIGVSFLVVVALFLQIRFKSCSFGVLNIHVPIIKIRNEEIGVLPSRFPHTKTIFSTKET